MKIMKDMKAKISALPFFMSFMVFMVEKRTPAPVVLLSQAKSAVFVLVLSPEGTVLVLVLDTSEESTKSTENRRVRERVRVRVRRPENSWPPPKSKSKSGSGSGSGSNPFRHPSSQFQSEPKGRWINPLSL
ncbi:MAG: hypothetical protein ACOWWM_00120, partial [Desulfobacterales bacterium]